MKNNVHLWSYVVRFFLELKNVSDNSCRESQTFFLFETPPQK